MSGVTFASVWWLTVELLGLIALPLTLVVFKRLPDRGYAFSKVLAILLVSFILWLLAYAHVLPNTRWAIILIIAAGAIGSLVLAVRRRRELAEFFRRERTVIIATEAVFLLAFVAYLAIRAFNPDILFGEKPMDFAFMNGILRSTYFPPIDPWLAGYSISYYYGGYQIMAMLTMLTGVPAAVSFNLSLALVFALTTVGAFSVVYNLVRMGRGGVRAAVGMGLVAAGLLLVLGNLVGVLEMLHAHGFGNAGFWEWVGIAGLEHPYHATTWYPNEHWWWWRSTRLINTLSPGVSNGLDYTITEFPAFSFLFADLHPHLMALPFSLLTMAMCLELMVSAQSPGVAWFKANWPRFLVFAIALGSLGFINTWDITTYSLLFALAALIGGYLAWGRMSLGLLKDVALFVAALVACAFVLYLPFYIGLDTQVQGIGLVGDIDTQPHHFFLFWGVLLFITVSFVVAQSWGALKEGLPSWGYVLLAVAVPVLPFVIWAVASQAGGVGLLAAMGKLWHVLPLIIVLILALLVIVKRAQRVVASDDGDGGEERASIFAMVLLFTGFLLVMGCELFLVKDFFYPWRMNTMFKLYYMAWLVLAISAAYGLYWIAVHWRPASLAAMVGRATWWVVLGFLILGSLIYPVAASITMYDFNRSPTLNGLAFVESARPSEYEAIAWLNSDVEGAPVIVEATGGYFTDYFRVSARTGLPTILGCPGHERQWRGGDELFVGREADIDAIYEGEDMAQVEALFQEYDVTYVYVGHLEREQYGEAVADRFAGFMDVAFANEGVTIYQVRE